MDVNGLNLEPVKRVEAINKEDFLKDHVKPQKPVVIEKLTKDWKAYDRWHLDYIAKKARGKTVPLYDDRPVEEGQQFNEAHAKMKMEDYVDLLQREPTDFRIFLYSLMDEVPELQEDFKYPDIGLKFLKKMPFLFFGGEDAKVFMHFDIDYANIMHFQFHGKKRCIIYPPSETKYLYKVPHALISREDIDFANPNLQKFPALKKAKGYVAELDHGQSLYMPEGYWHHMHYLTPGFSMSLRSLARNPKHLANAFYNIFVMRNYDNFMRKWKGQNWIDHKDEMAYQRTHERNNLPF